MGLQDPGRDGTVGKALEVLDMVATMGRPVRFAQLQAQSSFPKATLYRLVQTLTSQGMLAYDPDRQTYAMGMRLVRMAHAAWHQSSIAPIARPHLEQLSEITQETVHLAQLDGASVLYVDKRNTHHPIEMYSAAGKVGPAYCTGVGKAMLAFVPEADLEAIIAQQSFHRFTEHTYTTPQALRAELTQIAARGYGFDRQEHEPGIICIAMPILSDTGRVLGAASVTSSTARTSLEALENHLPHLRAATTAISRDLQNWAFPDQTQQKG